MDLMEPKCYLLQTHLRNVLTTRLVVATCRTELQLATESFSEKAQIVTVAVYYKSYPFRDTTCSLFIKVKCVIYVVLMCFMLQTYFMLISLF